MEERKMVFDEKDNSIELRINKLSKSKERMTEDIKREHETRFQETQSRFKSNLTTYRDTVMERFTSKARKAELTLSEIKESLSMECSNKRAYKQNSIEKVRKKNEELMALRKREMVDLNIKIDRQIEQKQKEIEHERQIKAHEAQIKQKHRDEIRQKVDHEFVTKISKVTVKLDRIDK